MAKRKRRPRGGASLPCPLCARPTRAQETRRVKRVVRRQRRCLSCFHTFTSEERHVPDR